MIKALLFDFDGVIMDTESPEVEIWREIYGAHGVEFPLETWLSKVVGSTDANFDPAVNLAALTGIHLDAVAMRQQASALRLEKQALLAAMPGVAAILANAGRLGLRLAIVSSSPHWWVDGYLRQLSLTPLFERVVCREDAAQVKPAPDLYLKAMEWLGLENRECLAIEDSPNGILAAKRAGLRVVGIPNPITAQAGPLAADVVLHALDELSLEAIFENLER